jgi:hypothetical protein
MIHFGKNPQGDLEIKATGGDVAEVYELICHADLRQRRTFYPLKHYIEENFKDSINNPLNKK